MSGSPSSMSIPIMGSGDGSDPYMTKIGGSGKNGIQIPQIQFQSPKMNTQQQSTPMTTVGQGVESAAGSLTQGIKTAYNLYQQRFGQLNQTNTGQQNMSSDPGGAMYGNPSGQQVGPVNPTPDVQSAADATASDTTAMANSMPSGAGSTDLGGGSFPSGGGDGGMGAAGGAGMGIAGALSAVSSAAGKVSQQDAKIAANPPKPTITGQPFTNFQFNPFLSGGDLS